MCDAQSAILPKIGFVPQPSSRKVRKSSARADHSTKWILRSRNVWTSRRSTRHRKRVLNPYPGDGLSCVQILRQNPVGAALESRSNNESVPESNPGFVLDAESVQDFDRGGFNTPDCIGAHDEPCGFLG